VSMAARWYVLLLAVTGLLLGSLLGLAADPDQKHREGFSGRATRFLTGDANIAFQEKDHTLSDTHSRSARTAEYIKIEASPPGGSQEAEFVHYYYATPNAPISAQLTATLHVKAYRPGIQVKARIVFPREKDPRNPDAPLTTILTGDKYTTPRQWQSLGFGDIQDRLRQHLPVLRARVGREIDSSDAYIDRLILNVYSGPGVSEVWVDDLEIGPVQGNPAVRPNDNSAALPAARTRQKGLPVEFVEGQILVDEKPFFILAIRHSGTPLSVLREAQFNTVWFPNDASAEQLEDAIRHGFWIVPTLPLPAVEWDGRKPKKPTQETMNRDADQVSDYLKRFSSGDAVLMWDLGGERTAEDLGRVLRISNLVRDRDPRRPRAIDLWDGFNAYSRYATAIGAHRWPLFSSLDMAAYKDWLLERKALVPPGMLTWSWVQTHLPEWYLTTIMGRPNPTSFPDPIGPHPEQIRILTYLALAAGHRGLGYWSDKFLENPCHGRDRLLELALLNAEIEMLKPVLFAAQDPARWQATSHPLVQAAVIKGPKDVLVLPVWLGGGVQHTPMQGVVSNLTIRVPAVPETATAWSISPAGVTELKNLKRVSGGLEVTLPEFDTAAAIVFTTDIGKESKIVQWQDETRFKLARQAAQWAQQQAIEQFNKTLTVHTKIVQAGGPELPDLRELLAKSRYSIETAKGYADNGQNEEAYREARRAMRPLRAIMRTDWERAVQTLDMPTSSPYAIGFYSLPQHWQLAREVAASRPGGNAFEHGDFELSRPAPKDGAAVDSLPGWEVRKLLLDPVDAVAAIINVDEKGVEDEQPKQLPPLGARFSSDRAAPRPPEFKQPQFGQHCLKLEIKAKKDTQIGAALERAVLAVDSPPTELAPGSLVRISFWAKVPRFLNGSADGFVVFDSAGGEPLGIRLRETQTWRKFNMYRRVPATGKISMTFALTGIGVALVDDVKIEPLLPAAQSQFLEQTGGIRRR